LQGHAATIGVLPRHGRYIASMAVSLHGRYTASGTRCGGRGRACWGRGAPGAREAGDAAADYISTTVRAAGTRVQAPRIHGPGPGHRARAAGPRLQAPGCRPQAAGPRLQAPGCWLYLAACLVAASTGRGRNPSSMPPLPARHQAMGRHMLASERMIMARGPAGAMAVTMWLRVGGRRCWL